MEYTSMYPSPFAERIMDSVGLYPLEYKPNTEPQIRALREFQQMTIGGAPFDMALRIAYQTFTLTDEQRFALKVVAEGTRSWTLGHLTGLLGQKIEGYDKKDFLIATQLLIEEVIRAEGGNGPSDEKAKSLIVKLTK